jgi:hypothetical protein
MEKKVNPRYLKEFNSLLKNPDFEVIGEDITDYKIRFMTQNKDSPYYFPDKKYTLHVRYNYGHGEYKYPKCPPSMVFLAPSSCILPSCNIAHPCLIAETAPCANMRREKGSMSHSD